MDINISPLKLKPIAIVTGGTGFIGHHLVKRLVKEGWLVHAIIRKSSKNIDLLDHADVTLYFDNGDTDSLSCYISRIQPSMIFHLASNFLSEHDAQDIEPLVNSNLLFGTRILDAMRIGGARRIINTGTSWQHYKDEAYNPVCLYAAMKQAYEAILEFYRQAYDFKIITLKLFDTYGPQDRRLKLFNLLQNSYVNNKVLNMSHGDQKIDLVHINDVVNAYLLAANRLMSENLNQHEIYAVTSSRPIELKKIVELYSLISKKEFKINWGARDYRVREVMNTWGDGSIMTGWTPKIKLEDGLKSLG
jgi:nucleoside-diphosphate-sugar epimerase